MHRFVRDDFGNGRCCANCWWPIQLMIENVGVVRRPSDDHRVEAP